MTIGRSCPGMVCALPLMYLPMRGPMARPPARAITPPIMWTTPEPAKSQAPLPQPRLAPRAEVQPPPQIQQALMQYGSATIRPNRQKLPQPQRSAMVPVGMVAVVSMKTISKKNRAMTPTSLMPWRKNPLPPRKVHRWPEESVYDSSGWFSTLRPGPRAGYQPGPAGPLNQLPQPMAKPYT
jgi:hypothetical protein